MPAVRLALILLFAASASRDAPIRAGAGTLRAPRSSRPPSASAKRRKRDRAAIVGAYHLELEADENGPPARRSCCANAQREAM